MTPNLTPLTPAIVGKLRILEAPNAPWARAPEQFWDFLVASLNAGVSWSIQPTQMEAHLPATTKPAENRKQQALDRLRFEPRVFDCGIGIHVASYVGGQSGTGWQGDGESRYQSSGTQTPGRYDELSKVMEVFWPDIPPLLWTQVRPLLSKREDASEPEYYGATSDYKIDTIDALAIYRFLEHTNHLAPVHKVENWAEIINPTVAAQKVAAAKARKSKSPR